METYETTCGNTGEDTIVELRADGRWYCSACGNAWFESYVKVIEDGVQFSRAVVVTKNPLLRPETRESS